MKACRYVCVSPPELKIGFGGLGINILYLNDPSVGYLWGGAAESGWSVDRGSLLYPGCDLCRDRTSGERVQGEAFGGYDPKTS